MKKLIIVSSSQRIDATNRKTSRGMFEAVKKKYINDDVILKFIEIAEKYYNSRNGEIKFSESIVNAKRGYYQGKGLTDFPEYKDDSFLYYIDRIEIVNGAFELRIISLDGE